MDDLRERAAPGVPLGAENDLIFTFAAEIISEAYGDVPKRLKGADSKSARRRKACGGSNPSISAIKTAPIHWMGAVFIRREGFEPI